MVDFAGWSMPVQYDSIVSEHVATRTAATLFDVSHMGRFRFDGCGAVDFLDHLLTRSVTDLNAGQIRYSVVTKANGNILDDVLVYRLAEPDGTPFHWLVVNAGNRDKIAAWIHSHIRGFDSVSFADETLDTTMIAVQGPQAINLVADIVAPAASTLDYYYGAVGQVDGQRAIVSRTGYTGEDGCELIVPSAMGPALWERLLAKGSGQGVIPAGLGARDTLRLEAAMPLYGHELGEDIDPFQAGLGFAVNLNNRQFIGSEALARIKSAPRAVKQIGLRLEGKRVAREHYAIFVGNEEVGRVTSGSFSPTLNCPIAMAYVKPTAAELGQTVEVDIRGRRQPGRIVKLPFYRRSG